MANLSLLNILPDRVAVHFIQLKRITSKMHKTSSSIAFIKKAIHNAVTPTFAKVKGQFINKKDQLISEKFIMKSHLNKHYKTLHHLIEKQRFILLLIKNSAGKLLSKVIHNNVRNTLSKKRLNSFITKNKKIYKLINLKQKYDKINFAVPIINLSNYRLNHEEINQLKLGLDYSFVDRNKNVKKILAANIESIN